MDKRIAHLRKNDPILGDVIKKLGIHKFVEEANYFKLPKRPDHFRALVRAIIGQQLSTKAAATIADRFIKLFSPGGKKFPSPKDVLAIPAAKMRKAGLSRMKVSFIKDLSGKVLDKTVDLKKIHEWTDEEVIEHLVRVKGIGIWTAEMFLLFSLRREDIFSYGDLGLRNAIQKIYKLKNPPTLAQAEKITAKWKPYRSLGSRYLWASLDTE